MPTYYVIKNYTKRVVGVTYSIDRARENAKNYSKKNKGNIEITKTLETYSHGYKV